jgi:hypothetical protein
MLHHIVLCRGGSPHYRSFQQPCPCEFHATRCCTHELNARTHARTHTHKHTRACARARTHAHAHSHTHTRTHPCTHPPTRLHTHSHARMQTCTNTLTQTRARARARTCLRLSSADARPRHVRSRQSPHVLQVGAFATWLDCCMLRSLATSKENCSGSGSIGWPVLVPRHADARNSGAQRPRLHQEWARPCHLCAPCHICTGTGLIPATSAPGLGPPLPHRQVFDARGKVQSFTHILETKQPASQ